MPAYTRKERHFGVTQVLITAPRVVKAGGASTAERDERPLQQEIDL